MTDSRSARPSSILRRPLGACLLLLSVYMALSLFNDPRGYLGTDTGGKVATLKVMAERHRLDPDIGYWAERWDPEGRVHPLYYTSHLGHRWVNATTLPVLYAAYPLYRLGGYRLALLLPALGSVLAALAARALARRLSGGEGWPAFWCAGLASPLVIYAADIWEHSIGVAAMAWAVVCLLAGMEHRRTWHAFLCAGALFGLAATLRTEALVYAFVAVGIACVLLLVRRRPGPAFVGGALAVVGAGVPLALNYALEMATVGVPLRFHRATSTASVAVSGTAGTSGGDVGAERVREGLLNAVGLIPSTEIVSYVIGVSLLALIVYVCVKSRSADIGPAAPAAVGVAALYAVRFAIGPGFVPGLVAATPLAAVGLAIGWASPPARYVLAVGLASLPLVWATQFQGGAVPQWAGRYLLVSGLLFATVGAASLPKLPQWARTWAVGLAVGVTAFGLVWTSLRTHTYAHAAAVASAVPEPVVLSRIAHLAREGGAFYGDRRWLTAPTADDQRFALGVLEQADVRRFALVQVTADLDRSPITGWRKVRSQRLSLAGVSLTITGYEAVSGPAAR